MSEPESLTAANLSLRSAVIMLLFTIMFTALMALAYAVTHETIEASAREEQLKAINEVLPPHQYDNVLLDDYVVLGPTPSLGLNEGGRVYRARRQGKPVASVLEANAPDGYSGKIGLVLAVAADGNLSGVRVTNHHETPGLGDYIVPAKDKNKVKPWITQFNQAQWSELKRSEWKVRKDGGRFDAHTGATISARAVVHATARAMAFVHQHQAALYATVATQPLPEGK